MDLVAPSHFGIRNYLPAGDAPKGQKLSPYGRCPEGTEI